eukprot:TRINITY_DN13006_c2_g1_i1.p1 TRINITY_DN13006_c2_g1~~TRINITY_DN13006_c2_g1_i1.p1  ORF type:complete len:1258 (+),score=213.79 TRINITY_DN13006_c2_g1_i1:73-3846(+)
MPAMEAVAMSQPSGEVSELGPLRLNALGTENLAVVTLSSTDGSAGEALDWLATALPRAREDGGANGGIAALAGGIMSGTAVVVPETALKVAPPKGAKVDEAWVALEVTAPRAAGGSSPAVAAAAISTVGSSLTTVGVRWRALPGAEAATIILVHKDDLPAGTVALARQGHLVGPTGRVAAPVPEEDKAAVEKNSQYVGVWSLLRREETVGGKTVGGSLIEHAAGKGPLRMQAPSGVFAEIWIPDKASDASQQESCAGYHAVVDGGGGRRLSVRHRTVDFRPPTGVVLCTQVRFDREVLGELSHPRGRCRDEYIEAWTRLEAGPVVSLELVGEVLPVKGDGPRNRTGYWLFCGGRFARIIGPPRGEGLVAGACVGSLAHLEAISGSRAVHSELRSHYEACWGRIEAPGCLRINREAWAEERAGQLLYDVATGVGGTITFEEHHVLHKLPNGVEQRWRVRDWGFDPFTPPAPKDAAARSVSVSSQSSSGSSSRSAKSPSKEEPAAVASKSASRAGSPSASAASRSRSASASASSVAASAPPVKPGSRSRSRSKQKRRHRRKHRRRKSDQASPQRTRSRRRRHKHRRRRRRSGSGSANRGDKASRQQTPAAAVAAGVVPGPPPGAAYPYGPYRPQAGPGGLHASGYPYGPGPLDGNVPPRRPPGPDMQMQGGAPPGYPGGPPVGPPPPGHGHMPPSAYQGPPGYPRGPPPAYPHGMPGAYPHGPPHGVGPPPLFGHAPPPGVWSHVSTPSCGGANAQQLTHNGAGGVPLGVPPVRPPSPQADPIATFVLDNGIDKIAEDKLRGLAPDLLRQVMSEGGVTGVNPSAVLVGRIRAVEEKAAAASRKEGGANSLLELTDAAGAAGTGPNGEGLAMGARLLVRAPGPPPPGSPGDSASGTSGATQAQADASNGGTAETAAAAATAAASQQLAICAVAPAAPAAAPVHSGVGSAWGEPAGVGSGWGEPVPRREEVKPLPQPTPPVMHPPPMPGGGLPPLNPGGLPPHNPGLPPPGMPPVAWPGEDARLGWFCRQHGIDGSAERLLRQLHPELQRRVLDEGPVGGPNPSLELVNRIHRFEAWEHGHATAAFLSRCYGDTLAEEALRSLPMEQQRIVMSFGPLMSSDPSAELHGRIRDVTMRCREGGEINGDTVHVFALQNAIDSSAEAALRTLPSDLQRRVLEEGSVRGTKNPSAVLMSRIRRVRGFGGSSPPRPASVRPLMLGDRHERSRSRSPAKLVQGDASTGPGPGDLPPMILPVGPVVTTS